MIPFSFCSGLSVRHVVSFSTASRLDSHSALCSTTRHSLLGKKAEKVARSSRVLRASLVFLTRTAVASACTAPSLNQALTSAYPKPTRRDKLVYSGTRLPTIFLPTFASNGRIYELSEILPVQLICLSSSRLDACEDFAHWVRAPPLPPVPFSYQICCEVAMAGFG